MIDLGFGTIPSFSPDGSQLTFTRRNGGLGTMNVDGTNSKTISNDGWGSTWSPAGEWIVFEIPRTSGRRRNWNLEVLNLKTGQRRDLMTGEQETRYARIHNHMGWSPDGRMVVFKGAPHAGGSEVGVVSIDGSDKGFQVLTKQATGADFSWHPNGKQILMTSHSPAHNGMRLFVYDLQTKQLSLFDGLPPTFSVTGSEWSPDGKQIVVSGSKQPEPARWFPPTGTGQDD